MFPSVDLLVEIHSGKTKGYGTKSEQIKHPVKLNSILEVFQFKRCLTNVFFRSYLRV